MEKKENADKTSLNSKKNADGKNANAARSGKEDAKDQEKKGFTSEASKHKNP